MKALLSVIQGVKNLDLIFSWNIKFLGKVSVGDKKIGLKFWPGVKISGVLFVGGKFRHPLKIFVTFPRHFFPDKVCLTHNQFDDIHDGKFYTEALKKKDRRLPL